MDLKTILFVKDGKGCTASQSVSCVDGTVVRHLPEVQDLPKKLEQWKNSEPRKDDIWLLSFPKSGTHWLFEITGILLSGKQEALNYTKETTFFELVPWEQLEAAASPRVLDTHIREKFVPRGKLDTGKVILIIRNPKSTAVSYYHHIHGMSHYNYEGSFEGFYEWYMQGIDEVFGTWLDYTTEWWDALKDKDNALIMFYEDLKKDPVTNIQKLSNFLGLSRDHQYCTNTASLTSSEAMKSNLGKPKEVIDFCNTFWKNGKHQFVRKGEIDDWKNYFTPEMNADFQRRYDEKMKDYPDITARIQYE